MARLSRGTPGNNVVLDPIVAVPFLPGGYRIRYQLPQNAWINNSESGLFLCVNSEQNRARFYPNPRCEFEESDLASLYALLNAKHLWGQKVPCWIYPIGGRTCNKQVLPTPIRWFEGRAGDAGALAKSVPRPKYLPPGQGRRLIECAGQLFFTQTNGQIETSEAGRGFDPFTYILSLVDTSPRVNAVPVFNGSGLAAYLKAIDPGPIPRSGTLQTILASVSQHGLGDSNRQRRPLGVVPDWNLLLWNESEAFVLAEDFLGLGLFGFGPRGYVQFRLSANHLPDGVFQVARFHRHASPVWSSPTGRAPVHFGLSWQSKAAL
jgi:hypothetical protein